VLYGKSTNEGVLHLVPEKVKKAFRELFDPGACDPCSMLDLIAVVLNVVLDTRKQVSSKTFIMDNSYDLQIVIPRPVV